MTPGAFEGVELVRRLRKWHDHKIAPTVYQSRMIPLWLARVASPPAFPLFADEWS